MRWLLCALLLASSVVQGATGIDWQPWTEAAFAKAKAEKKLLVLDLEAIWCHWCHVMDEKTYSDPKVVKLFHDHIVALRVDQDSRPDLSNRYEDYGWPATIIFDSHGEELAKRSGYIPPEAMAATLEAFIKDPTPGPSVQPDEALAYADKPALPDELRAALLKTHAEAYDPAKGGWVQGHKYLEWTSAELALGVARGGDQTEAGRLKTTLNASRALIDPAWGGVYQYSVDNDWKEPHFEKIMQFQAEVMRIYALAYGDFQDSADRQSAAAIMRFVKAFLTSPDGAFYTSMDADLKQGEHAAGFFALDGAGRRKLGVPRVDTHQYARENGWMINALCDVYGFTGEPEALAMARRAAAWTEAKRATAGGGYRHGDKDPAGPYLGDTLAMGRAWLSLYLVTGERPFLAKSEAAAAFVQATFANSAGPGYLTAKHATGDRRPPLPNRDEMAVLARWANLLGYVTGEASHAKLAESAMRYLATPGVARRAPAESVLLAAAELGHEPTHVTVVGAKNDPAAKALFQQALKIPGAYKRVEWWDRTESHLRHMDVVFPELKSAAAFACTGTRCSLPIVNPDVLLAKVAALGKKQD